MYLLLQVRSRMVLRLQELAMMSSFPTNIDEMDPANFLKLLSSSSSSSRSSSGLDVYDFTTDVCIRPGMGCVGDSRSPSTLKVYAGKVGFVLLAFLFRYLS